MAYRRKQVTPRATTFVEDFHSPPPPAAAAAASASEGTTEDAADVGGGGDSSSSSSNSSSLAAQAMRASAAHRHSSSLSSAYGETGLIANGESVLSSTPAAGHRDPNRLRRSATYNTRNTRKEGVMMVESRTADIIEETKKLHIRRKSGGSNALNVTTDLSEPNSFSQNQNDHETQLKASRDVANVMAAKSKLLLREMKTVKADLAFAKERCNQLEDENRLLRESREKGDNHEDEDLIRLQLETLLEEKGRLAHENSVYARENRFLREIVEYHQLTMQDVVYVDEGIE